MKTFLTLSTLCLLTSFGISTAHAQECVQQICVGGTVLDYRNRVGTVNEIDGQNVIYSTNGTPRTSWASNLAHEIENIGLIRRGNNIIDRRNRVGSVTHVFSNNMVQYNSRRTSYVSSEVSPQVEQVNGIEVDDVVIDRRNRIGTVSNLFEDGRVRYTSRRTSYVSSEVSQEIENIGLIRSGHLVIDRRNRVGSVVHVFADGRVNYDSNGTIYTSSEVSAETQNIGSDQDLFSGVTVIDRRNRVGSIENVFEDGRVRYNYHGTRYVSSEVSPEVQSHEEFNKTDYYSDGRYYIGKATLFFKDGRIEFISKGSIYIRNTLFAQVDSLGRYSTGTTITEPSGYEGLIKMVFENGAVLYEVEKPHINFYGSPTHEMEVYELSAKIYGVNHDEIEDDQSNWIHAISNHLRHLPPYDRGSLIIESTQYESLKTELLSFLQARPDIYEDATREGIVRLLSSEQE